MQRTTSISSASLIHRSNRPLGKTLLLSSLFAVAALGCAQEEEPADGLAKAIPTPEQVAIKVPKGQTRAIGQVADFYSDTRAAADEINSSAAWALMMVRSALEGPAQASDGKITSWGPWTSDGVDYKLVVTNLANGGYEYLLTGRQTSRGGAFETLISGTTIPGATEDTGRGQLTVDFDADERIDPSGRTETGKITLKYDLAQRSLEVDVTSLEGGVSSSLHHAYKGAADGGGELTFAVRRNTDGGGQAESVAVRSRWQASGAGRGDARISGGDVDQAEVTSSQCWDSQFKLTYSITQVGPVSDPEGTPGSCVFASAELPPRS
ncbi:MAG TPA: hypothetical protein PKU97_20050 [Kofleriaceae bacterium]|nr:hypothetical protein [Kofleriaceae bacterium]